MQALPVLFAVIGLIIAIPAGFVIFKLGIAIINNCIPNLKEVKDTVEMIKIQHELFIATQKKVAKANWATRFVTSSIVGRKAYALYR